MLSWLATDHFTFLGYREYDLEISQDGSDVLVSKPETGLGILRSKTPTRKSFAHLPPQVQQKAREPKLLIVTKANRRSTVHRPTYLDYVGIKKFDSEGKVTGELRFVGLLSAATYADSATAVPIIRQTIARAIELSKYAPGSHYARDLMHFCETFPRDELFQVSPQQLIDLGRKVLAIGERHQTRVFTRNDDFGRFASVLVYLPRDRYTTDVRIAITEILERAYGSDRVDYVAWVSESVLARLHFVVRMPSGRAIPDVDEAALNRDVAHATQTWDDDFAVALVHELGEEGATDLLHQFGAALPEAYKEDVSPREAIPDIASLAALKSPGDSSVRLHDALGLPAGEHRFTLCRLGESVELFELLPVFASLGAHLLEERPYELTRADGESAWVYDVTMKLPSQNSEGLDPQQAARFCEAFLAAWRGDTEVDGLNALVSTTSLTWREVALVAFLVAVRTSAWFALLVSVQRTNDSGERSNCRTARALVSGTAGSCFGPADTGSRSRARSTPSWERPSMRWPASTPTGFCDSCTRLCRGLCEPTRSKSTMRECAAHTRDQARATSDSRSPGSSPRL